MTPGRYDLELYRGDTYEWQFILWNDPDKIDPSDLTGVTVNAQIRPAPGGPLTAELVCDVTLPNTVSVSFPESLWPGIVGAAGVWDLQLTYPSGTISTIIAGSVRVTDDITRVGLP